MYFFPLKSGEVSGRRAGLHSAALLIFLHFHKITAEFKTNESQASQQRATASGGVYRRSSGEIKHDRLVCPDANFPLFQQKATIHKVGNVPESHHPSFVDQEQLADKRRESVEGGGQGGAGGFPIQAGGILGEQQRRK